MFLWSLLLGLIVGYFGCFNAQHFHWLISGNLDVWVPCTSATWVPVISATWVLWDKLLSGLPLLLLLLQPRPGHNCLFCKKFLRLIFWNGKDFLTDADLRIIDVVYCDNQSKFIVALFSVTRRSRSDESHLLTDWVTKRSHWLYWCNPGEWRYL